MAEYEAPAPTFLDTHSTSKSLDKDILVSIEPFTVLIKVVLEEKKSSGAVHAFEASLR